MGDEVKFLIFSIILSIVSYCIVLFIENNNGRSAAKTLTPKKIGNILMIGAISCIIFVILCPITYYLRNKSFKQIDGNYEIVNAEALAKQTIKHVRASDKHYITGRTADGYVKEYYVRRRLYNQIDVGDTFSVYKYGDDYEATLSMLVKSYAGTKYIVCLLITLSSAGFGVSFMIIGLIENAKWKRNHKIIRKGIWRQR